MASRRRRRKSIGKVIVDVERRVRRVEKRPGAKRLKTNVVTTEKLGFRAVSTKTIQPDAVTANEAEFGVTVVSPTDPDILKEGTTVVDPTSGSTKVYSTDINDFVTLTDPAAQAAADGKNSTYYQDNEPTGGTYLVGDIWIDTNDNDKLYAWDGTDWVLAQDSATAQATADGKTKTYTQDNQPTGGAYNVGDLWIDTNDGNKLYRFNGTSWVAAQDAAIATAQSTANGKNTVYYSTSAPGSTANTAGDIWWQYASGIVVGQFVGTGGTSWTSAPIGNAVIANLDAGKITTGFLDVAGTVKITTDKTKTGLQPRIEINSNGFFAYNGSTATVSITNTGTAVFTGSILGSSFESTNFASGNGVSVSSVGSLDRILLDAGNSNKLAITANSSGAVIFGPGSLSFISMPNGGSVFISTNLSSGAQVTFASTGAVVNQTGYTANSMSFRNILASTTPLTNGSSASGYLEGEIYLVY